MEDRKNCLEVQNRLKWGVNRKVVGLTKTENLEQEKKKPNDIYAFFWRTESKGAEIQ